MKKSFTKTYIHAKSSSKGKRMFKKSLGSKSGILVKVPVSATPPAISDVTPTPTPNWPTVNGSSSPVLASQQILGINTPIVLSISWTTSGAGNFSVSVNNSNTYAGGTITNLITSPTTITVNNNQYVWFSLNTLTVGTHSRSVTVTNTSDSNIILDTFTVTLFNEP